jgi:hypothetical protein
MMERLALEWFVAVAGAVFILLLLSPLFNWLGGNGFTWYF